MTDANQQDPPESGPAMGNLGMEAGSQPLKVLGDFELRRVIGRGGMGTVYEAWQRSLARIVALKVLAGPIGSSPKAVERFQREARAAAKLHHSHIVPIHAQGEVDGTYFYAMELVEGLGLNSIIAYGREMRSVSGDTVDLAETVPLQRDTLGIGSGAGITDSPGQSTVALHAPDRFIRIARHIAGVADALDYAHRQGVIHRDIKPHNLMLGDDGRLRVTDFGLARVMEQPGVTMTGEVVGSPLYMAPEQLTKSPAEVDHRADIYSLGATLYEWLALRPPFPGETRESVIRKILTDEPAVPRSLDPLIPIDLETICLKAMDKNPARRYSSAADMREDLERFISNRSIHATRAGLLERARKFVARHQIGTLAATAAVVALVLTIALWNSRSRVREKVQQAARIEERASTAEADREKILDMLGDVLATAVPVPGGSESSQSLIKGIVSTGQELTRSGTGLAGTAANPDAVTRLDGIANRAVTDLFTVLATPLLADDTGATSSDCRFAVRKAMEERDESPEGAMTMIDKLCLEDYPDDAAGLHLRISIAGQMKNYSRMFADAQRLLSLGDRHRAAHLWRGLALLLMQRPEQSIAEFEKVADQAELGAWAHTLKALGLCRTRPAAAIEELDAVIESSPDLIIARLVRARAFRAMEERERAVEDMTHVINLEPDNINAVVARGDDYQELGQAELAIADYEDAMDRVGESRKLDLIARWLAAKRTLVRSQESKAENAGPTDVTEQEDRPENPSGDGLLNRLKDLIEPAKPEDTNGVSAPAPSGARLTLPRIGRGL